MVVNINNVKFFLASCVFPSPNFLEINAFPPEPNIVPTAIDIINSGITMLTADRASVPIKLDTKTPSIVE